MNFSVTIFVVGFYDPRLPPVSVISRTVMTTRKARNVASSGPTHSVAPSLLAVPQSTTSGRRAGNVTWLSGVRSAIVLAAEHSPRELELDWWSSDSKLGTLRDGAR